MLRKRVVTVLTFNEGVLFRTKLFRPDYRYTLNFVDAWSVDEVVVLDVSRSPQRGNAVFLDVVRRFAERCFVPLTAGGGISDMGAVERMLKAGADKVAVNTAALDRPDLVSNIARRYGSQCVVLSMDVKRHEDGSYEVYGECGSMPSGRDPVAWARQAEALGAGEILLTAMDRDGWLQGYDLTLCRNVSTAVGIPTLVLGGAGQWKHFAEAINEGGADAVCTQNIYHFTESSIRSAKRYLSRAGVPVRV